MDYQKLVKKGLLKKEKIEFDQINKVLRNTFRCIRSSKILVKDGDEAGGFQLAYEAMLLAGRALVFSYGLRPRSVGSHRIVIEFSECILGEEYKTLTLKFDKMRKKRNYLIYGTGLTISKAEVDRAINSAQKFVDKIEEKISHDNPQQKLWRP